MDKTSSYNKISQNINYCFTNIQKPNYDLSQGQTSYSTHTILEEDWQVTPPGS